MSLTNEDLLAISKLLDEKLDAKLDARFDRIDAKFDRIDAKFDQIDAKFDQIDAKFDQIDAKFGQIDERLNCLDNRLKRVEVDLLENNVIPRLSTIESCYLDTYERYKNYSDRFEVAFEDIDLLKRVVSDHSEKLNSFA